MSSFFKKIGQTLHLFVYFVLFHMTNIAQKLTINDKSVDGVLGTWTPGGRMVGTDKSTELFIMNIFLYFSPDEGLKRLVEMQFNDSLYYWKRKNNFWNFGKKFSSRARRRRRRRNLFLLKIFLLHFLFSKYFLGRGWGRPVSLPNLL